MTITLWRNFARDPLQSVQSWLLWAAFRLPLPQPLSYEKERYPGPAGHALVRDAARSTH